MRVVGTHNTVNKVFHLVAFECMFTHRSFTLEKGILGKAGISIVILVLHVILKMPGQINVNISYSSLQSSSLFPILSLFYCFFASAFFHPSYLQSQMRMWLPSRPVPVSSRGLVGAEMLCSTGTRATMTGTRATPVTSWALGPLSFNWLNPTLLAP